MPSQNVKKIRQKLEVVPKWVESVVLAIRNLEGLCPRMESLNADIETLKTDLAQCWSRGSSQVRSVRQDESATSTSSWEQIRVEAAETPAWRKRVQQGSPQTRVSMRPESIIQSGPMTQMGPGFNITMGTRNDDEGEGLSGGHGQRMVHINMFTSTQTATQAPTEVKSGGLPAILTNIRNAPEGPTEPVPGASQAQMGQQGGGIFSGAKSFLGMEEVCSALAQEQLLQAHSLQEV